MILRLLGGAMTKIDFNRDKDDPAEDFSQQPILSELLKKRDTETAEESLRTAMILERRFLSSLFGNTHACMRPRGDKMPGYNREGRPERVHFASVSLSLDYLSDRPDRSHYELVDNEPYRHLTYSDRISISQFRELVLGAVTRTITIAKAAGHPNDPIVVVVNEFGFPFFRRSDRRKAFYDELNDLAETKGAYIVCGSSHKVENKRNVAVLAHPAHGGVIEHAKYSPAVGLEELLGPRHDLDWRYYSFEIGKLGILICFDAIDPTVLQRQIYYSRDMPVNEKIDIFVIPSFSHNEEVRKQAEMLSYFTKSIVLYSNHQYGSIKEGEPQPTKRKPLPRSHGLFIGGEDVLLGKAVNFKQQARPLKPQTFALPGTRHWASIQVTTVDYARTILDLDKLQDDFSPLMREIVEMARFDWEAKKKQQARQSGETPL